MKNWKSCCWVLAMSLMCLVTVFVQGRVKQYLLERSTHLKEYEYFKDYNSALYFNDFLISETWKSGKPYYSLTSEIEGIHVVIDKNQSEAEVLVGDKSLTFPVKGFINTNANLYLADLTADGRKELIYEEPMSGAEGNLGNCIVVELNEMKILEMQDFVPALLSKIEVEPISQEKDQIMCKITDASHHIYFGSVRGKLLSIEHNAIQGSNYSAVEYDWAKQSLKVYTCFTLQNCEEGSFLGDISAHYYYNQKSGIFELEDDFTISLWNPLKSK